MVTSKKLLSIVLSIVMVFTVFSVAIPEFAPIVYAAPVAADYQELAEKIRTLRENDENPTNAVPAVSGNNATYTDNTGDMLAVANKYFDVYAGLVPASNSVSNTTAIRTATQINAAIKTEVQNYFTSTEIGNWAIVALLDALIANASVDDSTGLSSNAAQPSFTLTVTDKSAVLRYDSVSVMPNQVSAGTKYTFGHTRKDWKDGCDTKYFLYANTPTSASTGNVSTAPIKTLSTAISTYAEYYTMAFDDMVATDVDTLTAAKNALSSAYNAVIGSTAFNGSAVYAKFFSGYDTAGTLASIEAAIAISTYIEIAQNLQAKTELDITDYSLDELSDLYFDMKAKLGNYNSAPATARNYLEEHGYIDMDAVAAKFEEIENAYEIAYLRDSMKPRIEADLALYATYDDDWTIATDGVEGILAAAELELDSVIEDLCSRKSANVEIVFGSSTADYIANTIDPVTAGFAHIREVNGYNLTFKQYQSAYNSVFAPLTLEESSTQLLNILTQRDSWYTELQAFVAELSEYDAEIAAKIFTDAEAVMESKIDQTYAALNAILENEINDSWAIYQTQADEQGLLINEVNLETYNTLRASIGLIEVNVYEFLDLTEHFDLSAEAVEKYEALKSIVLALNNYNPSRTLSAYKYNAETIDPIVRYVSDKDNIRDRDFTIQNEYYENLIVFIDELLTSGKLSELGIDLDLGATLDGLADTIYTDKFLNTIVGGLYPMLVDLIKDKIGSAGGIGSLLSYISLDDAFEKINSGVSPSKVGALMKSTSTDANGVRYDARGFTEIANKLSRLSGGLMDDVNPWYTNTARQTIWEKVLDDEGNEVLDDEGEPTWQLTLDWGIDAAGVDLEETGDIEGARDARKEQFLKAANAGLVGLERVFLAMLSNRGISKTSVLNILIASASLQVPAKEGYNNTIIPLLEALGCTDLYNGNSFKTIRDIIDFGLIHPVHDLFGQLKISPVDKIITLLPNLAFAIQSGLFLPLLQNLVLHIDILLGGLAALAGDQAFDVNLGDPETLDLADILGVETFYDDVKSLDGVLSIVLGLLAPSEDTDSPADGEELAAPAPELKLPHLDGAKLAMLGTDVVWADSYRSKSQITYEGRQNIHASIIANKPQVMQFLLEYILEAIQDDDFIPAIMNMMSKDEAEEEPADPGDGDTGEPEAGPAEDEGGLPDIVLEILENVKANGTDAIAAIYELVHPVYRYTMPDGINWITEGTITEAEYTSFWNEVKAEGKDTLWSRNKALYMTKHLDEFMDDIVIIMSDQFGGAEDLEQALDYMLGSLFKAETLNNLAGTIRDLVGGLELPEMIADLGLIEQVIDLTVWDDMTFDFADGDKAAFKAGLITLLDPLAPLLGFILAEQDINIGLLDLVSVTGVGYNGYAYGLIPLLEVLGATGIKSPAALIADPDNIVKNIIDPVFSILDKVEADPISFIETALPALLYFDRVDGIQVAIEHLLTSVNVLLDIIRPIYDVDFYALVADQTGIDLHFAETDPVNFLLMKLNETLQDSGLAIEIDFTVESLSSQFNFTEPIRFTSANGDDAYTIALGENGKIELMTRTLDFAVDQLVFGDNATNLIKIAKNYITDEDQLYLVLAILQSLDNLDSHVESFYGIDDVALATIFWIFFGADSVTDATADWFHRYTGEGGAVELISTMYYSSTSYITRAAFVASEFLGNEFPHLMQALTASIPTLIKPIEDYNDDEMHYLTGILARIVLIFSRLLKVLRSLLSNG
ncbi:MAG: hypothetical protein K6G90_02680 [Clostridia bacterium]|nr:hypothetical protein [Clostridia bacterium]